MKIRPSLRVDIDATASVVELADIRRLCSVPHLEFCLRTSINSFQFANATYKSIETITLPFVDVIR